MAAGGRNSLAEAACPLKRGGKKNRKVDFELAARLFPFSILSHFQKHKVQLWTTPGSAACRLVHYTKEILKNTRKNLETGYFNYWP